MLEKFGDLQRRMAASIAGIQRRQAILETILINRGDTIIDIGCGGGQLLEHLAKAIDPSGHVYGLDPSEGQLEQAKKRCKEFENVTFIHGFADNIALESNSCNIATSTQTFEYVKDIDSSLNETTRLLASNGQFANVSILWDHFKFFGAEDQLNETMNDAFKAHCHHQMLPLQLPGKLKKLGYINIRNKALAFVITSRDQNSPAIYTEEIIASFALSKGVPENDVALWRSQLAKAEEEGRFGFTSFPVLTTAYLK